MEREPQVFGKECLPEREKSGMTYYLIDYENTGENGLDGINILDSHDRVIIFYSENADKMSFDLHQMLQECGASIEFKKITAGKKNALDFQLATYLGYLMAKAENGNFCIVSKDLGYEVLLEFWKGRPLQLVDMISAVIKKEEHKLEETGWEEKLRLVIPEEKDLEIVRECVTQYKTKQAVNNALVKHFGSEKAGKLYKKIKPLIKNKKGK